jgi:hypothetical protein
MRSVRAVASFGPGLIGRPWRGFPGSQNQGDCVSFVATGGKNPPAGR